MELIYLLILIIVLIISTWLFYFFYKPSIKKSTSNIYMEALNAMLLADKKKAISLLSHVVKEDSEHINAYLQLGNLLREEDTERAIKIHQMLTVRQNLSNDLKIEIFKALAQDYDQFNDLAKAKIEAEKVLDIDKSNLWANKFLLSVAEKTGDWDYAEKKAKLLTKLSVFTGTINLSKYTMEKGIENLKNNNLKEAENLFRKSVNDSPKFGLPYKYLGDIKHANRDLVKAVEYWEKYIELSPNEAHLVFDDIEAALFDLGRYSEVEKFYRKALDANPNDINAGQRLANVLNEKGENKAAISLIDQFIDVDGPTISVMLMKLKLSITKKTPAELGYYVDEILKRVKNDEF